MADVLKRRCAHNRILSKLEHCGLCLDAERARAVAKAGPRRDIEASRAIPGVAVTPSGLWVAVGREAVNAVRGIAGEFGKSRAYLTPDDLKAFGEPKELSVSYLDALIPDDLWDDNPYAKMAKQLRESMVKNAVDAIRAGRVETATGAHLDMWGAFFNVEREPAEPDDSYRERIREEQQTAWLRPIS
jgi:hypothetical protein